MPEIDEGATFVPMRHKVTEGVAMTTITAFKEVHSQNGWERVTHENTEGDVLTQIAAEHSVIIPGNLNDEAVAVSNALNPDLAPDANGTATNLGNMLKEDLVALAEERGVDSSGTKGEIIARLTGEEQ